MSEHSPHYHSNAIANSKSKWFVHEFGPPQAGNIYRLVLYGMSKKQDSSPWKICPLSNTLASSKWLFDSTECLTTNKAKSFMSTQQARIPTLQSKRWAQEALELPDTQETTFHLQKKRTHLKETQTLQSSFEVKHFGPQQKPLTRWVFQSFRQEILIQCVFGSRTSQANRREVLSLWEFLLITWRILEVLGMLLKGDCYIIRFFNCLK